MSDKEIEQKIQAKGKTAPRVTPDHIESIISDCYYFTAQDGLMTANPDAAQYSPKSLDLLTFCVLVLKNGFTVTGESACASPDNFDAEIGRKIARTNAVQKIWALEGYLLKQRMHDDAYLRDLLRQKE
ncbi:TPA: Gp49 family protein [Serratia marcescens]